MKLQTKYLCDIRSGLSFGERYKEQ